MRPPMPQGYMYAKQTNAIPSVQLRHQKHIYVPQIITTSMPDNHRTRS